MSSSPRRSLDLDLLKSLDARARPASEHFGEEQPKPAPPSLDALVPHAERIASHEGSCFRVITRAELSGARSRDGYVCPADGFDPQATAETFALLGRDPRWRDLDPESIAYLDIETTSLAGGSGTYAFLIGLGRFERAEGRTIFSVRQYMMEDYTEERALIEAVGRMLAGARALVSFNGRTFDVPILEARWRLNRKRPAFPALHLDLLHPARRLWREALPNCRLETIERDVLGVMRVSDVQSARIPQIFFEYTRGIQREQMLPVLDHHAQDIYSLGALGQFFTRAVTEPEGPHLADAPVQWGLAQIFHGAGRHDDAVAALERAVFAARDEDLGFRLSMHLARRLKRLGREAEAVEIWSARTAQARLDRLEPLLELAKHAEHRLRDFDSARSWTQRALEIARGHAELRTWIDGLPAAATGGGDVLDALVHRLSRLERRSRRLSPTDASNHAG